MPPGHRESVFLMAFSAEKMRSHAACVTELACICQEGLPSSQLLLVFGNLLSFLVEKGIYSM